MKKCPVCKKRFLAVGLVNHIINKAEAEAYVNMHNLFNYNKKDFKSVSRAVLLRNMPHLGFYRRHLKNKDVFEL